MLRSTLGCGLLAALLASPAAAGELEKPVRLKADGKYVDTAVGHAAPFVCDLDGDGKEDLLVGDFNYASTPGRRSTYHGWVWLYLRKGPTSNKAEAKPKAKERWF